MIGIFSLTVFFPGQVSAECKKWVRDGEAWRCPDDVNGGWQPVGELPEIIVNGFPDDYEPETGDTLTELDYPELTHILRPAPNGVTGLPEPVRIRRASEDIWYSVVDPAISISVSVALQNGDFLTTDDNRHQALAQTQMLRVRWSYSPQNNSGQIAFLPADSHSPGITFNPTPAP